MIQKLIETEEVILLNLNKKNFEYFIQNSTLTKVDVIDAEDRLKRFVP
ncbi:TPA: hypothetical protein QCX05_004670 [Bacillus pacificus]|nr:hypothetical protein IIK_05483 [Bacillus cereus VD102]HDR7249607.1 hypothetical protein [Bacillus pacificus]